MTKNKTPEEKAYSLKEIELRSIANINGRANAAMLDFVSFIALERLNIDVTENTQFRVDDGKLYVTELPADEEAEEVSVA